MPTLSPSAEPPLPSILERILRVQKLQVAAARARVSEAELRQRAQDCERRDFLGALRQQGRRSAPAVIAELKRASPSRGRLREDFDVAALAAGYEMAGAAALSVLTEEEHFEGQLEYLMQARRATRLPILRKDFIYCSYQVWEAAAAGADAILLIAAMLDDAGLKALLAVAAQAGLAALCEVHDQEELGRAARAGATCIGVNNRDLNTFAVDVNTALELGPLLPPGVVGVAESGLRSGEDLARMARAGYQAVLIGESFMQAEDPGSALARTLAAVPAAPLPGFVKICGITNLEDARAACDAGADAVGFVFAPSPRRITAEQVRAIGPELPVEVLRVGVFAGTPVAKIEALAESCGLHAVQLHGAYAAADGQRLAARVSVWRALAMPTEAASAAAWTPHVERFVLDSAGGGKAGGTGISFAWEMARTLALAVPATPLIVAGGLRPENVAEAIRRSGAAGVDVASGVEARPGRKNPEAVAAFVAAARAAFARRAS